MIKCRRAIARESNGRCAAVLFAAKVLCTTDPLGPSFCGQRPKPVTIPRNSCIRDNVDFRSSRRLFGVGKEKMLILLAHIQSKSSFSHLVQIQVSLSKHRSLKKSRC